MELSLTLVIVFAVISTLNTGVLVKTLMYWLDIAHKRDIVLWQQVVRARILGIGHIVLSLALWGLTIYLWWKV